MGGMYDASSHSYFPIIDPSSCPFRRSRFIRSRGLAFADAVNPSSIFLSMTISVDYCRCPKKDDGDTQADDQAARDKVDRVDKAALLILE